MIINGQIKIATVKTQTTSDTHRWGFRGSQPPPKLFIKYPDNNIRYI